MPKPHLLYFVNSDGAGHWQRAQAILRHTHMPVMCVAESAPKPLQLTEQQHVEILPPLRVDNDTRLADDCLHIPYGTHAAYHARLQALSTIIAHYACHYAMIDVCVETAMTMRLAGIPYCFMRMHGNRNDDAHSQAYRAADCLLSSYPALLEQANTPTWVREKTHYVGGIVNITAPREGSNATPTIICVRGKGMNDLTATMLHKLAVHYTQYQWIGIGFDEAIQRDNLTLHHFVDNPQDFIRNADIIIASTGNNAVLEAGYFGKKLITCPQPRYFDEQYCKADMLAQHDLAVVTESWPKNIEGWDSLLQQANVLDTSRWDGIVSDNGAQQAARFLMERFQEI